MSCAPPVERGFFPLDEELDLPTGSLSPRLAEAVVLMGTLLPFEQVPHLLGFFTRVEIDEDTARRRTESAGATLVHLETAEVERILRECPASPPGTPIQQLSADGAMVPLVHGKWAEVKTLVIGTVSEPVTSEETRTLHTGELSYFSRLTDAESFTRLAVGEIHRRGTERAGVVCAVMDGAEWLQGLVDQHRPDAVRILDFPHAAEHVCTAAHAVLGSGTAAASEWLGVQLQELKQGDPGRVLAALRALPAGTADRPEEAQAIRDGVIAYLEKRRTQIQYAQFTEQGYPIASGAVESANKLVVEARLKGSGMHWAPDNVNPMLALRTAVRSRRWGAVWRQITQSLQQDAAHGRQRRREQRRCADHPAPAPSVLEPLSAARPTRRPAPIRSEPKGLMKNGRPTGKHPWKNGGLSHRPIASSRCAKL